MAALAERSMSESTIATTARCTGAQRSKLSPIDGIVEKLPQQPDGRMGHGAAAADPIRRRRW
jgi:hypothetical protein